MAPISQGIHEVEQGLQEGKVRRSQLRREKGRQRRVIMMRSEGVEEDDQNLLYELLHIIGHLETMHD